MAYCSQDLHSGTRLTANETTFGLYFSGFYIFRAIIAELSALPANKLTDATNIILSGDSAGGIGYR